MTCSRNLTSYLAVPDVKPIPNSFEELAARKDMNLIVEDRSQLAEDILVFISIFFFIFFVNFMIFLNLNLLLSNPNRVPLRYWATRYGLIRITFSKLEPSHQPCFPPVDLHIPGLVNLISSCSCDIDMFHIIRCTSDEFVHVLHNQRRPEREGSVRVNPLETVVQISNGVLGSGQRQSDQ